MRRAVGTAQHLYTTRYSRVTATSFPSCCVFAGLGEDTSLEDLVDVTKGVTGLQAAPSIRTFSPKLGVTLRK